MLNTLTFADAILNGAKYYVLNTAIYILTEVNCTLNEASFMPRRQIIY